MQKTIYWPDNGTWHRLERAAERAGLSVSEYIRRAVMGRVERDERKLLREAIHDVVERAAQKYAPESP